MFKIVVYIIVNVAGSIITKNHYIPFPVLKIVIFKQSQEIISKLQNIKLSVKWESQVMCCIL